MKWKPYPAYKDSGYPELGKIPEQWSSGILKRFARMEYGEALASDVREGGIVPVYGSNGTVGMHSGANTSAPAIIIGRKGSFGRVSYTEVPAFCIDTAYYIDPRYTDANVRWLYYSLQTANLDDLSQDTGVPGLSRENAHGRPISHPSAIEQHCIATVLDRECSNLDRLIAKQERLIEVLEEKRQATISHAVTKGLNPKAPMKDSGVAWLGTIPAHWRVTRLKFATSQIVDCPHETPTYDPSGEFLVIRTADLERGTLFPEDMYRLNVAEYKSRTRRMTLAQRDIVYGREGERWGHAALVPESDRYCLGQRMMQFRTASHAHASFLMWQLNAVATYRQGQQDTVGATSPHVNVETIKNYWLADPPLEEQIRIARHIDVALDQIDKLITKARQSIDLMHEHRAALISAAVTGKIDVREAA